MCQLSLLLIFNTILYSTSLPYYYSKKLTKTGRYISPALTLGFNPDMESVKERYVKEGQNVIHKDTERMMGLDTGNPQTNMEAGMWIAALIGSLAAAIPAAFLNPSLGVKKKRSVEEAHGNIKVKFADAMRKMVEKLEERDL